MARIAMWCATASSKPSSAWATRTASAKVPPPGTTITGARVAATMGTIEASWPLSATLPPSLMTVDRGGALALDVRDVTGRYRRSRTHDLDADRSRPALQLLDAHQHGHDALIGEAPLRDALGHGLDQIYVPGRHYAAHSA